MLIKTKTRSSSSFSVLEENIGSVTEEFKFVDLFPNVKRYLDETKYKNKIELRYNDILISEFCCFDRRFGTNIRYRLEFRIQTKNVLGQIYQSIDLGKIFLNLCSELGARHWFKSYGNFKFLWYQCL